jgi:HSP20 family protein
METTGAPGAGAERTSKMAIQRWDPLRDLLRIQERVNELFEDVLSRSGGPKGAETLTYTGWKPPVDVFEEAARYVLNADLPGVSSSDVELEIEDGTLKISLPPSVDREKIGASHRDGVLEVVLPKRQDEVPSRVKVEVK